ncbi:alginate export family protein [Sphingomonas melonis]|uniref:alginate export family protein n=1 Tax=Sphingomonas melonis TaxID=152682 RepID=UPI001C53DEC0|nr:alginate export family protein [Sphingomonas melonis]
MAVAVSVWAAPAAAQTGPGAAPPVATEAWQAPTLTIVRYDEPWQRLADPAARDGRWTERFKYIPLGGNGAYLSTGIELRARNETYRNALWGAAAAADDGYLWLRALPYADLHVGRVRGFVQPIAAYAIGVAPSAGPVDETRTDLLQGFADVRFGAAETGATDQAGVTVRAGRQMLSFGSERLIGTRYGPNVPLAFDGARAIVSLPGARVDLLAVRPVQAGTGSVDDRRSRSRSLHGAYATIPLGPAGVDLYYLAYRNTAATFAAVTGDERRHSIGARVHGDTGGWHWNMEGVAQSGRFAGARIGAWTIASEIGRRFAAARFTPDAVLRVNVVSGDRRAGDGRLGTFNALFPKGKYFGELSPVGPTNIISVNPRTALVLGSGVSASLAAMAYWRQSRGDGVYDIPGTLIRAPGASRARFIGKQVEATLAWQATPELELSSSLSAFAPGGFIRQTGAARTIGLLGVEANVRF